MVEPRWSIKCTNSTLDLLDPSDDSYTDLRTQHRRRCWKYFCWCRRHTISVICINESRKLYWFNCRSVQEKVTYGPGEGYYHKLLRLVNGALNAWAQRYIDGLSVARREIMFRINGSAQNNMRLLKEGCYCHYHPHMTADACNADFLRRVVSFWAGESLRGIRERLRGMTNITKKVETRIANFSLFFSANVYLLIFMYMYIHVYTFVCSRIYIFIYFSPPCMRRASISRTDPLALSACASGRSESRKQRGVESSLSFPSTFVRRPPLTTRIILALQFALHFHHSR